MHIVILVALALAGACIGAMVSWRHGTTALGHAIDVASAPKGMRGRDYRRVVRHQRKRRRLVATVLWTAIGAALGVAAAFAVALLQAVR